MTLREWCRAHDGKLFAAACIALVVALLLLPGCASTYTQELVAHEEMHCQGWSHTGTFPFYDWSRTRPASVKPWVYLSIDNPDEACRYMGVAATRADSTINACAIWMPKNCIIILPKD